MAGFRVCLSLLGVLFSLNGIVTLDLGVGNIHASILLTDVGAVSDEFPEIDITWNIYTRQNRSIASTTLLDLDATKPLKMLVHGFLQNAKAQEYLLQKDIYLSEEDCIVVILDWSKYNNEYTTAVLYTSIIGQKLGYALYHLYEHTNFTGVHLLGHSLGAHMAGFAGKEVIRLSEGRKKLARITGWDAALPMYNQYSPENRLAKDDAVLVDVIHTDGNGFGVSEPIGKVDFYPNGGVAPQPGCENVLNNVLEIMQGQLIGFFCSHSKCREFYRKSITNTSIMATRCGSWAEFQNGQCDENEKIVFGEHVPSDAEGTFYLRIK